jgi:hypothetical protein
MLAHCTLRAESRNDVMTTTPSDHNQVRLVLHEARKVYSIGEPVRPKLQILNTTDQKIVLNKSFVLDWEDLAFAEPNFIHLVGPGGAELALPYRRDISYFDSINPISVDAGNEEWLYLPIYAHFHLRELGEYTFWLDISDNKGAIHYSNRIKFNLIDVDSSILPEFVELTIQPGKSAYSTNESINIEANFTNKYDMPLVFLKPQEDSFYGWVNPVYQFTVIDSGGRTLALALRSGTMAIPAYNETTQFAVAPGSSAIERLRLPDFPGIRAPGDYRLRLTYIVREKAIGKAGVVLDKQMNWGERAFTGRIESNELKITIK